MLNNVELEKTILYALRKSLKDYYIKHKHGMMLMKFDTFTNKDIMELCLISLFDFNLNETCNFIVKNLNNEIVIKDFNGTTFDNIELENIIFNSLRKAIIDLYLKYGNNDDEAICSYNCLSKKEIEECISSSIGPDHIEEFITFMANYLKETYDVKELIIEDYQGLEDYIVYPTKTIKNLISPCKYCDTKCFGMPEFCEKANYAPGTRPQEIRERVKQNIMKDVNQKYLEPKVYHRFDDSVFGIKWFEEVKNG